MGKKNKKLSPATEAVLDLAFLENDIELMTKEYLLVSRDLSNRVLPTRAYPNRWRTIHRKMKILENHLIYDKLDDEDFTLFEHHFFYDCLKK